MARQTTREIVWYEVVWPRPYDQDQVCELLAHLASLHPRGPIIFEIRSHGGRVRHMLGVDSRYILSISNWVKAHGDIQLYPLPEHIRQPVAYTRHLNVSRPGLSLNTETTLATIRAGLAALASLHEDDEAVIQIILGRSHAPALTPKKLPDPNQSWLSVILSGVSDAPQETRKSIREKNEQHCFEACIRIGVTQRVNPAKLGDIISAFRTLESSGVRMKADSEDSASLNGVRIPWRLPLRLSIKELVAFLLLPFGEEELPGVSRLHPKEAYPPKWYQEPSNRIQDRTFAMSELGLNGKKLSISPQDSLEHTIILGPTGSGKSTTMLNLIIADIYAGRSVLVIDPKEDLVTSILESIPEGRAKDVVVISPSDPCPVGFNPLSLPGDPTLIADSILAVFKEIFAENWGIRSQDILSAALLTLIQTKGASLLWLPDLLTNDQFRRDITSKLEDRVVLKPFWKHYDAMREAERRQEIAPVLNKIRQFLYRPGLRSVLGQSDPKFQLTDLFYQRKIVLVPLNKGMVGPEVARLLGSLIVGLTWTLALSRASIPPDKRHLVSLYIDELQDYLCLPTSLSDALAQARGLGVGITMAHQYRAQLPPDIRAGVDANARNKICFGLNAIDAKEVAPMAPELTVLDFMSLPRYEIYANFMSGGKATGWIRGTTLPPPRTVRSAAELRAISQSTYGRPAEEVDAEYLGMIESLHEEIPPDFDDSALGRRKL